MAPEERIKDLEHRLYLVESENKSLRALLTDLRNRMYQWEEMAARFEQGYKQDRQSSVAQIQELAKQFAEWDREKQTKQERLLPPLFLRRLPHPPRFIGRSGPSSIY